jgi:hypothetical protein
MADYGTAVAAQRHKTVLAIYDSDSDIIRRYECQRGTKSRVTHAAKLLPAGYSWEGTILEFVKNPAVAYKV